MSQQGKYWIWEGNFAIGIYVLPYQVFFCNKVYQGGITIPLQT